MRAGLPDSSILATAPRAVEFTSSIRNSSTEYDVIGKHSDARILLCKEGARRMYGLKAKEAIGKLNSEVLHAIEDVASGRSRSGFFQDRNRPAGVGLFELQRPQELGAPAWAVSPHLVQSSSRSVVGPMRFFIRPSFPHSQVGTTCAI